MILALLYAITFIIGRRPLHAFAVRKKAAIRLQMNILYSTSTVPRVCGVRVV